MNNGVNPITNVGDDSAYGAGTNYNNGYNPNSNVNVQNENVMLRANTNTFSDVSGNQVNISEYVNSKGLMVGTGDTSFNPNGTVTRAQMVQTLYAMAGKPPVSGDSQFSDVSSDKWYNDAINWAQQNGIVAGYTDGSFKPNQEITREQMLAIMNKYATYCGENTSQANSAFNYSDANNISNYAVAPISWGVEHGMISDNLSNLRPTANATRIELAQMLMRYDQDYNGSTGRSAHVGAGAANMQITDVAGNRAASQASSGSGNYNVSGIDRNVGTTREEKQQKLLNNARYCVNNNLKYVDPKYTPPATLDLDKGTDCSGFMQALFSTQGVNIDRTTYTQANNGYEVEGLKGVLNSGDYNSAISSLQPGDLIICNNGGHVAMYSGNGKIIHGSANAGKFVEVPIEQLNYMPGITAVRRVV